MAAKFEIFIDVKGFKTLHNGLIFNSAISEFEKKGYKVTSSVLNASDYGVPQKRERVIIVAVRNDIHNIKGDFEFPQKITENDKVPLSVAVPILDIEDEKYYFSERAVLGLKKAKNNMKRGLAQNLDEPCLTVTSHLAKTSLNSRDPVLLVDPKKELYRRFTPKEAARIQSFPDTFEFADSEFDSYKQIGNAIPPVMFWHIAKSVSDYLSNEAKK
jgi:DNA (cytosine-5)-methyltransferase 1